MDSVTKKSFYFIRHGQTDWNFKGLCMGHSDIPLNEQGRMQARSVVLSEEKHAVKRIYYSPLIRAKETMELITDAINCPKIPLNSLKEWHFGLWEGTPWYARNITSLDSINPPQGETKDDFFKRTLEGINIALDSEDTTLIIGHTGTYWAICHFLGLPIININNCELVLFEYCFSEKQWLCKRPQKRDMGK